MSKTVPVLAGLIVLAAALLPAQAGLDVEFGASVRLDDDTDLYLAINSRYFDRDRDSVRTLAARYGHPDDLAVALFIGARSGRAPGTIFSLRQEGLSWWEISLRFGLPLDVWFVEVPRDPGPPYGHAYGHWKKHKRHRRDVVVLTDADLRNLVAVRMLHEYYDVPVELAMEWRSSGSDLRSLMSTEYHRRHRRDAQGSNGQGNENGNGHPGRGHGKKPKKK